MVKSEYDFFDRRESKYMKKFKDADGDKDGYATAKEFEKSQELNTNTKPSYKDWVNFMLADKDKDLKISS